MQLARYSLLNTCDVTSHVVVQLTTYPQKITCHQTAGGYIGVHKTLTLVEIRRYIKIPNLSYVQILSQ